jgi:hypothetical protein
MKMTDKEKGILKFFRKIENEKSRDDLLFQAEIIVRAQEAFKEDYGITGQCPPKDAA